jgi:hypothetical protein
MSDHEQPGFRPTLDNGTPDVGPAVRVRYTNWRGETADRAISPVKVWFGTTEFHPSEAWLLHCYDHGKTDWRDYALADCDFRAGTAERDALAERVAALEAARKRAVQSCDILLKKIDALLGC